MPCASFVVQSSTGSALCKICSTKYWSIYWELLCARFAVKSSTVRHCVWMLCSVVQSKVSHTSVPQECPTRVCPVFLEIIFSIVKRVVYSNWLNWIHLTRKTESQHFQYHAAGRSITTAKDNLRLWCNNPPWENMFTNTNLFNRNNRVWN